MRRPRRPVETSIAIFLFGLFAFSPPILSVFGAGGFVFELPLLYLYLFGAWGLIIGLQAWMTDLGEREVPEAAPKRRQTRAGTR